MIKAKLITVMFLLATTVAQGQQPASPPAAPPDAADSKPPLKAEELEQLLAPIALYPDSLLTQMLMASTYPLEIVEADRWVKAHKDLKGDALAAELAKQTWDASVISLVNFPDVLAVMSEKLDITMKLGDAFIAQQKDVLATVQLLRAKAQKAGNLKSSENMKVESAPTPPPEPPAAGEPQVVQVVQQPPQVITIESPNPQVIQVPSYQPTVVYGSWPYPPPPPYYPPPPPGYNLASGLIGFGVGVACGAAWGYAFGGCNWGGGDVDIDVNRNTNFNKNVDRSKYQNQINSARVNGGGKAGTFQHDPSHRKGAPYSNQASAQKFGGSQAKTAQARQQYRGQADAGRQNLASDQQAGRMDSVNGRGANQAGGARAGNQANNLSGQTRGGTQDRGGAQNRSGAAAQDRGGAQNRTAAGGANTGAAQNRASSANTSGSRSSAFDGADRSASQTRAASERGQASRSGGAARPTGGGAAARPSGGGGAARSAPRSGGGGRR